MVKHGLEPGSDEGIDYALKLLTHELGAYFKHGRLAGMFPERWLPACFAVLPEAFTEKNLMINSTFKMVRGRINEKYATLIDFLYTPEGKNHLNEINRLNLKNWYRTES